MNVCMGGGSWEEGQGLNQLTAVLHVVLSSHDELGALSAPAVKDGAGTNQGLGLSVQCSSLLHVSGSGSAVKGWE